MTDTAEVPALLPVLPEIVLAVGAMILLMVGAFRAGGERANGIDAAAILLLVGTGCMVVILNGMCSPSSSIFRTALLPLARVLRLAPGWV